MTRSRLIARLAAAATVAQFIAADYALAQACATPAEKAALDTRVLQSELMVAAISCQQSSQYNAFVAKFQPELVANGSAFRQYFKRTYGASGEHEMNQMVTRLANGAATRRMQYDMGQYCAAAANLFSTVLSVAPGQLGQFAAQSPHVTDTGVEACPVQAARERAE